MTGRAVLLPARPTAEQRSVLLDLVATAGESAGHPVLSEAQRSALLGPSGTGDDEGTLIRAAVYDDRAVASGRPLGMAQALPAPPDGHFAVELVVDPGAAEPVEVHTELLAAVDEQVARRGGGTVRVWATWADGADDRWAHEAGFDHERDLLQLRCGLPLPPDGRPPLSTRPFRPGRDEEAWLRANNRAFAGHPEQGGWTLATLRGREAASWFDPAGFRLHDEGGTVAAWCWTKVHDRSDPPMGEIYVIGVDPDFQGRGWGRALTRAGLDWLAGAGLSVGMLYVDAANRAAVGLYRSLGFSADHTDRAYRRVVAPKEPSG